MKKRRALDLVILSDVHLGSYGCHAEELTSYLKSINPKTLVLNGDLIDIWQFKKYYWPDSHMAVLKELLGMLSRGTTIYYLTGNHDEMLRKYSPFRLGNFQLVDKLVLEINGKKAWIFHGDVFDITMKYSKFLAKLGGKGYNILILLNRLINYLSIGAGYGRISISRRIKNSVKHAVKYVSHFEETATSLAIEKDYDYVICGHIHRPHMQQFTNNDGKVIYLNSGDWVENLTSLEYHNNKWRLFRYPLSDAPVDHTNINFSGFERRDTANQNGGVRELKNPAMLLDEPGKENMGDMDDIDQFALFDAPMLQELLDKKRENGHS